MYVHWICIYIILLFITSVCVNIFYTHTYMHVCIHAVIDHEFTNQKIDIINDIVMYLSYILYYFAKRSVLHIEQLL